MIQIFLVSSVVPALLYRHIIKKRRNFRCIYNILYVDKKGCEREREVEACPSMFMNSWLNDPCV